MITETILALLVAIRAVESCDGLDRRAGGNDYQITKVCVDDVNRIYHTHYRWPRDVRDRETAEDIIVMYLGYYGMVYFREYGRLPSKSTLARIYNRGYAGAKRGEGHDYAKKIQTVSKRNQFKKR